MLWVDAIDYSEMSHILPMFDVGYVTYIGDTLNTFFPAPGKAYEYLKAGLILLTDRDITIFDDLSCYGCAIFFDKPVAQNDLSKSLASVATKPETIAAMKTNARRLFTEKYSFEKQLEPLTRYLKN
jgi:hypothetical protein